MPGTVPDLPPEDPGPRARGWFHRPRRPVFWRASDTLWFEPLIALMIVFLLLVSLYAFTQNWPPVYVVRSNSMQHGDADHVGLVNTGDFVLAQKVDAAKIVPYVTGMQTGYQTYGEFGDVILYRANGVTGPDPIIHRALAFIVSNPDGSYSIPGLEGLPCGSHSGAVYNISDGAGGCGARAVRGTLSFYSIGWASATVAVPLSSLGSHSGFLTMGDNNLVPGSPARGTPDQPSISLLVQPAWILGVSRGMVPWFGALTLLLAGQASMVPSQSWQFLGITTAAFLLIGMGIHVALRAEGVEDERRKEAERDRDHDLDRGRPRRWRALRRWAFDPDEDEEEGDEDREARHARSYRSRRPVPGRPGGRPRPSVRRGGSDHHGRTRLRAGSDRGEEL